jgi:hypothetical protein
LCCERFFEGPHAHISFDDFITGFRRRVAAKRLRVCPIDLKQIGHLVSDPSTDLFATIPHGTGQTILREALLVADHNAYHLGVVVAAARILKAKS